MKKITGLLLACCSCVMFAGAQVKIGDNPNSVGQGSLLELESTSKAFVLPRMNTSQMQAIPSPMNGMIVFNTDSNCIYLYRNGNAWTSINPDVNAAATWPYHSNNLSQGAAGNGQGIIALTGTGLTASGSYSHAEGRNSVASGTYAWATGNADTASGESAVAMGHMNKVSSAYGFSAGSKNTVAYQSGFALGQENTDSGWASMAAGLRNRIYNGVAYSHVIGYNNEMLAGSSNLALGESNSIRSGRANTALGISNMLEGNFGNATGKNNRILAGNANMVMGENNTAKSGSNSILLGLNNSSDGSYLGAIGKDNSVFNSSAIALGQGNKDSGWASIAGGLGNTITRNVQYSSLFGYNNLATHNSNLPSSVAGLGTFSAGINNVNSGYASIALGTNNKPSNLNSLAANYNNYANSYAMSAFGHFNDTLPALQNQSNEPNEMLFSIGNGRDDAHRRNSLTMLRNGFTTINASGESGANVPRAELDVKGTGALIVPVGTTAQRPVAPVAGMIRLCTDCPGGAVLQGYDGTNWVNL